MWPARCTIHPKRALDCAVLGHFTVQITKFRNQIVASKNSIVSASAWKLKRDWASQQTEQEARASDASGSFLGLRLSATSGWKQVPRFWTASIPSRNLWEARHVVPKDQDPVPMKSEMQSYSAVPVLQIPVSEWHVHAVCSMLAAQSMAFSKGKKLGM